MAQQKAIIDKLLSNVSSQLLFNGGIADMVLPKIQSMQKTGKLAEYGTGHLRIVNDVIGGEGVYPRIQSVVRSDSSYSIEGHGLHGVVTEDDYSNVERPYDAEEDETLALTSMLQVGREKGLADALGNTSVLTQNTTLSGTDQWSDYDNSDPLDDIKTGKIAVKEGCGMEANTAIIPWQVKMILKYHPSLLDKLGFKYNRPGGLTDKELADILEVERVLCPQAMYESAKEGQTSSLDYIWGKHTVLAHIPAQARKRQVSLGYEFNLAGRPVRRVFKQPTFNPPNGKDILVDDHYDHCITNTGAGYLIKDSVG